MQTYFWIPLLILIAIWYLTFSANRLDRLHHRAETSWANLDAILQRRAALALDIAHQEKIDPATNLLILSEDEELISSYPHLFSELDLITERLRIAISLHVEAVAAARSRREKMIYRIFRLAGHAPLPVKHAFEDDSLQEPKR
jgi:hypothetical protein